MFANFKNGENDNKEMKNNFDLETLFRFINFISDSF